MHLALAEQQHLMRVVVLLERQRRIVLHQLGERSRELDLVLAVLEHQPDAEHRLRRRRTLDLHDAALVGRDRLARLDAFEPAQRDRLAGVRGPSLQRLLAAQGKDASDALIPPVGAEHGGAVGDVAGQHAHDRKLAAVRGVQRLEHVGRRLRVLELQAARGVGDDRRLVAQRLQEPEDAVAVLRRAEQHRADEPLAQVVGQIVENLVARRRHIRQELLHQLIVVVGELLQHVEARLLLALQHARWKLDDLRRRLRAVDVGALGSEVDEAGGDAVLPDRDLAQHERLGARRLQHGDQLAQRNLGGVDLVQEEEMRNAAVLELLQDDLQRRDALGVGLAHDDGSVARGQRKRAFVLEFDGAGAVDEGEGVTEESSRRRR